MGWADTKALINISGVELVAICDVDQNVIKKRKKEIDQLGLKVKIYKDYRELLDQKNIDAVVLGTPDHWHALMMINASAAGKHVYCEKPLGNSIGECNAMVSAQKYYGNIVPMAKKSKTFSRCHKFCRCFRTYKNCKSMVLSRMDETSREG